MTENRTLYTGTLARVMYNALTKGGTVTTNIPHSMRTGGYYKEGDKYIAYDFTDGREVFMEELDNELAALRYALGCKIVIGEEEI